MSVLDNLKKSIARDRLSHAYLFIGEKGVGKLNCAKTFAKLLYCQNENKPCGLCISCKQIEALKHPNVLYISPEGQNIKKEQIVIKDMCCEYCIKGTIEDLFDTNGIVSAYTNYDPLVDSFYDITFYITYDDTIITREEINNILENM